MSEEEDIAPLTPEQYLAVVAAQDAIIEKAQKIKSEAYDRASRCPRPADLRDALPTDIVVGAVLWRKGGTFWTVVEQVRDPHLEFKGFMAGGCRYGYNNFQVEIKS